MASKVLSLSEEDAEILRRIIREIKQNPRPQSRYREEREIGQSPEVYVARTPAGGIPAIFDYPGTAADIPGSAECNVYRATVVDGVRRLFEVAGLTRIVHSLSYTAVPGNIYVKIERDKFGVWWVSSTPAQLDPGPDTPPDPSDPTGTGTGTGTGVIFGCDFTAEELESIAGPGLGVDFTGDCPKLKTETTPPECVAVTVYETDLRCETTTGTGTSQEGSLNLYRRKVTINVEGGCLTKTNGEWEFIRAVACCDPSCEQEASQEKFYWCINDGVAPVVGTIETDCCENLLPETLYATVTGACVEDTYALVYDVIDDRWEVEDGVSSSCDSFALYLQCKSNGKWQFTGNASYCGPDTGNDPTAWDDIDAESCDPLVITATGLVSCGLPCGTATIVITTTPP